MVGMSGSATIARPTTLASLRFCLVTQYGWWRARCARAIHTGNSPKCVMWCTTRWRCLWSDPSAWVAITFGSNGRKARHADAGSDRHRELALEERATRAERARRWHLRPLDAEYTTS